VSTENLFLVDPFNNQHIEMIEEFESSNNISSEISKFLREIQISMNHEDYDMSKKKENEFEEKLFIKKDSKIKDSCHLHIEKDRKICNITFAPIKIRKRKLLTLATSYALENLGMEEVFIEINPNDQNMIAILEDKGYESLGEEKGMLIYLKEKEITD